MNKTASPIEVQAELKSILAYCASDRPSREVVASRLRGLAVRLGMEFPTQDALEKYLKDHPDADKSKHTVKKEDDEGEAAWRAEKSGFAKEMKPKLKQLGGLLGKIRTDNSHSMEVGATQADKLVQDITTHALQISDRVKDHAGQQKVNMAVTQMGQAIDDMYDSKDRNKASDDAKYKKAVESLKDAMSDMQRALHAIGEHSQQDKAEKRHELHEHVKDFYLRSHRSFKEDKGKAAKDYLTSMDKGIKKLKTQLKDLVSSDPSKEKAVHTAVKEWEEWVDGARVKLEEGRIKDDSPVNPKYSKQVKEIMEKSMKKVWDAISEASK